MADPDDVQSPEDAPRSLESLIWEARAKLMWGDDPREIHEWLEASGVDEGRIVDILRVCAHERDRAVRKQGAIQIAYSMVLCLLGIGGLFALCWTGLRLVEVGAVCALVAAVGIYRFAVGLDKLVRGGRIEGSVSDLRDHLPL